jgi:hypothetical protein
MTTVMNYTLHQAVDSLWRRLTTTLKSFQWVRVLRNAYRLAKYAAILLMLSLSKPRVWYKTEMKLKFQVSFHTFAHAEQN